MEEIETYGTATATPKALKDFARSIINTSVGGIVDSLQLRRPIYQATATYGHFGRNEFPWEKVARL
jgi:S-adenosylmethionine synthetase